MLLKLFPKEKMQRKNKKGQAMIWVFVAILIVAGIAMLFLFVKGPGLLTQTEFEPKSYIEKCVRKSTNDAIDIMLPQGGFIAPRNYKTYYGKNAAYLCENIGYFAPCISQHPMLLNEMKKEITNYTSPEIEQCFSDLKKELEKRDNSVVYGSTLLNVSLGPDRVYVDVIKRISITKGENTQSFDNIRVEIISPLYDLGSVAIEIASQEAKYCYFEYVGYMLLYPRFDIQKFAFGDSTKIYTIKDKNTDKEMNIAIRSCAIPPGL